MSPVTLFVPSVIMDGAGVSSVASGSLSARRLDLRSAGLAVVAVGALSGLLDEFEELSVICATTIDVGKRK